MINESIIDVYVVEGLIGCLTNERRTVICGYFSSIDNVNTYMKRMGGRGNLAAKTERAIKINGEYFLIGEKIDLDKKKEKEKIHQTLVENAISKLSGDELNALTQHFQEEKKINAK